MKNEKDQEATDSVLLEAAGRKFADTPEGRAQLAQYVQELSALAGRQSNEVGEARKKLAKYQRIEAALPPEVQAFLANEEVAPEVKFPVQLLAQEKMDSAQRAESSHRQQWYQQASELVLEELPDLKSTLDSDLIAAFLEKHAIHELEDPLGEAKRLLNGKVRSKSAAPAQSEDIANVSVDASSPRGRAATNETPGGGKGEQSDPAADFFSAIGAK